MIRLHAPLFLQLPTRTAGWAAWKISPAGQLLLMGEYPTASFTQVKYARHDTSFGSAN